jgi:hypothetical protein
MQTENCKGEEHNELARDPLGGPSSLSSSHQSSPTQLHCVKTLNTNNKKHRRQMGKARGPQAGASVTERNSENMSVSTGFQFI